MVNKSYLVDHLDDSNMVLGVSIMFTAWTTGFIIGPSMAGKDPVIFAVEYKQATMYSHFN